MTSFDKYRVPDLTRSNTKWIFILESPHHTEIKQGYPAAGESGEIMSEVIFNSTKSFGRLIREEDPIVESYSVMNASCIPLQASCYEEAELSQAVSGISSARSTRYESFHAAKNAVKQTLASPIGERITENLKRRMIRQLESNPNKTFIVCGVVAQSIFEVSMNAEGRFHKSKLFTFDNMKARVFYENHPSRKSGKEKSKWEDSENIQPLLNLLRGQ